MAKFDWYQGTTFDFEPEEIMATLTREITMSDVSPGRPKNGYTRGCSVTRGDHTFAEIWWGGNPGTHVKVTGDDAPALAPILQRMAVLPSRVDVAEDIIEPGMADRLFQVAQAYAVEKSIRVNHQGDWTRGQARTLYLGARSSTVQLVIYEKGHQLGEQWADPNWVRLEVRLYPKPRHREPLLAMTPGQMMAGTRWVTGYLQAIGWEHIEPLRIGTIRSPSDTDRARAALLRQYGRIIKTWADEVGPTNLGTVLVNEITENKATHVVREAISEDSD